MSASIDHSMSYLQAAGPAGWPVVRLGWGLGLVSLAVMVIVGALLVAAILRRRGRAASPRALAVSRDAGGMPWIYTGVGITVVVLAACAVWTLVVLSAITQPAHPALTLQVRAVQWWWDVRYEDAADPGGVFSVANEIHIPVGQPVRVELSSTDVIHSFWIPQLGGKMDVIPGQTNVTWLQADHPGTYRGQCAEFCGVQHAHMAMAVVADSPDDWAAWRAHQLQPAASPTAAPADARLASGEQVFLSRCAACHAVRGAGAGGILGPDLTHLMSRRTIAAGTLDNTEANLRSWVSDAPSVKPGTRMPRLDLPEADLRDVVAYLSTLR